MAIAFDATSRNIVGPDTVNTCAHTCSGVDRILWVATLTFKSADSADYLSSITYNGVALTQVGSPVVASLGVNIYLHYLIGPSTGANNIVTTCNATMDEIDTRGGSFTGALQSSQPDTNTTSGPTAAQTSLSISTTTNVDNDFLVGHWRMAGAMTAGANTTIPAAFSGESIALIYSTAAITPAGSAALVCTASIGTVTGILASFKPSLAIATGTGSLLLSGVGS